MKLIEKIVDRNWTWSNLYQLERFHRKRLNIIIEKKLNMRFNDENNTNDIEDGE